MCVCAREPELYHWCVSSGVGFKKGCDDDWIEHQESFEQILAGLNTVQKDGI